MNGSSNARILRIAFAVSIAVHLIIASVVHSARVTAAPEQKPTRGQIFVLHVPKATPTPPPPKAPKHVVHTQAAHLAWPHVNVVRQRSKPVKDDVAQNTIAPVAAATFAPGDGGSVDVGPVATVAPATPSPTPKPACSAPDVPAKAVDAITPEASADISAQQAMAKIKVDLDASGAVVGAAVYETTGYPQLDHAALEAARESRYEPEEKDCRNIPGSYLFTVEFSG